MLPDRAARLAVSAAEPFAVVEAAVFGTGNVDPYPVAEVQRAVAAGEFLVVIRQPDPQPPLNRLPANRDLEGCASTSWTSKMVTTRA